MNQKDYLKRYLSSSEEKKKKKKKAVKVAATKLPRSKIIDDDLDLKKIQPIDNDDLEIFDLNDDVPQIVGYVDERPDDIRLMAEIRTTNKWRVISTDYEDVKVMENVGEIKQEIITPERDDKSNDFVLSPLRKRKNDSDSDASPPRRVAVKKDPDSDVSPPRREKGKKDADSDVSPPRRGTAKKHSDSDASPPRRRTGKKHSDSDVSPPRREKGKKDADSDVSPPRRGAAKKHSDSDASPPRKRHYNSNHSPPRRRSEKTLDRHEDKKRSKQESERKRDYSPKRQKNEEYRNKEYISMKEKKKEIKITLEGKKAGLSNAKDLRKEVEELRKKEQENMAKLSDEISGKNAQTIVRDRKTGKIRDLKDEARQKREDNEKEIEKIAQYAVWGKGQKQVDDHMQKKEDEEYEMSKPMARYVDDKDLEDMLKKEIKEGDPMMAYVLQKRAEKEKKHKKVGKEGPSKEYQGSYPSNRYNIKPGYRWDGVDRSNGFEKKWFEEQNDRIAREEEGVRWSTYDM